MGEYTEEFTLGSVGTGVQTKTVTLTKGTKRAILDIILAVGDVGNEWGINSTMKAYRTNGTPAEDTKIGGLYLQASNLILAKGEKYNSADLKLVLDLKAGVSRTVVGVVRYEYID